jgi:hypothetical protein
MSIWKTLFVILALFGLSWIGIVIGWLSWDQDRYYGNHLLKHRTVVTILLGLATGVMILTAGAIVMLEGVASLPLAVAAGIGAGVITYLVGQAQLRFSR